MSFRSHHTDGVIFLTPFGLADAQRLFEVDHDPEHRKRFDFPPHFVPTLEHDRSVILSWERERKARSRFVYAVRLCGSSTLVGGCEMRPQANLTANVSYWTHPDHRRNGYSTRAVALACAFARSEFGFETLEILTDPDNAPSRRIALQNGFEDFGFRHGRIVHVKRLVVPTRGRD